MTFRLASVVPSLLLWQHPEDMDVCSIILTPSRVTSGHDSPSSCLGVPVGLEVSAHTASGRLSANTIPLPDFRGSGVTVKAGGYGAMLRGLHSAVAH
jgi:hypothetical protein